MSRLTDMVAALRGLPSLGGRVYPVRVPDGQRIWPICVYREAGGTDIATALGGPGTKVPLVEITLYDEDYDRLTDPVMVEVRVTLDQLAWTVYDPPDDGEHDTLKVFGKVFTVMLQPE